MPAAGDVASGGAAGAAAAVPGGLERGELTLFGDHGGCTRWVPSAPCWISL
jgi:hypothetical protein